MSGPAWLAGGLAVLMIAIAVYCAGRLAVSRLRGRDTEAATDGLHVVMGVAMAGMFEPRLTPIPDAAWRAVFTVAAAWFAWQAVRAAADPAHAARTRRPMPSNVPPWCTWSCRSGHGHQAASRA